MEPLSSFIESAADALMSQRRCDEDDIPHNGRRAYTWTLLRWLYEQKEQPLYREYASRLFDELMPSLKKDPTGQRTIYPGLYERRNYSTSAIDCGIFLDAFYDAFSMIPERASTYSPLLEEMALTYNFKKIAGPWKIHNQYLWCATGLARWANANPNHPYYARVKKQLLTTVNHWLGLIEEDGYAPYKTDPHNLSLNGITTYYHSRCIAFSFYIFEQLEAPPSPKQLEALTHAGDFLLKMFCPSGVKQLLLESKRYYFWQSYEVGSHPYDLYAFSKLFAHTHEAIWAQLGARVLSRLLDPHTEKYARTDWQCSPMRLSHVAWLTRVDPSFIETCLIERDVSLPKRLLIPRRKDHLILLGDARRWAHFLPQKTPFLGHSGGRTSGLVLNARHCGINDLSDVLPLQYKIGSHPVRGLIHGRHSWWVTALHVMLHAWDWLRHKGSLLQAWRIVYRQGLQYVWIGLFERRTSFCLRLKDLKIQSRRISHALIATDLWGKQPVHLGHRTIEWTADTLKVIDRLEGSRTLRVRLPEEATVENHHLPPEQTHLTLQSPTTLTVHIVL